MGAWLSSLLSCSSPLHEDEHAITIEITLSPTCQSACCDEANHHEPTATQHQEHPPEQQVSL
jgi:hypothetical protein